MSGLKKIFSSAVESCIYKLYKSIDDVSAKRVELEMAGGEKVSFDEIQNAAMHQPFISTKNKSCLLDIDAIDLTDVDRRVKAIANIKKDVQTAVIEAIKIDDFPNVKYNSAELVSKDGKSSVYRPPRFTIDVSKENIEPHQGVRINTGYVFRMPTYCMGKTIQNNKIVNTSISKQINYVVLPIICSKNHGIIQTIYARDPHDTGLFTINFTTTAKFDKSLPIQVVLVAYSVANANLGANLVNAVDGSPGLFKNKDSGVGRYVRNPKVKFYAARMEVDGDGRAIEFPTFDNKVKPIKDFEKQRLRINDINAIMVSRKREWCSQNLVTVAGLFLTKEANFKPIVVNGSEITNNSHCLVFINKRITLFDADGAIGDDIILLNGAFSNLDHYSEIIGKLRVVASAMHGLSVGVEACKDVITKKPDINLDNLLKLYDYNRGIKSNDPKLLERSLISDRQMFEERSTTKIPYSANMYKALMILAKIFIPSKISELGLSVMENDNNVEVADSKECIPIQDLNEVVEKNDLDCHESMVQSSVDGDDDDDDVGVDVVDTNSKNGCVPGKFNGINTDVADKEVNNTSDGDDEIPAKRLKI